MAILNISIPSGWTIVAGKKQLRAVLRAAGGEVALRARALIRAGGKNRASLPGQPPANRSGTLARSIKVRPWKDGEGVTIRDVAFYALFLERGAKGGGGRKGNRNKRGGTSTSRVLLPRPFLEPALDDAVRSGLVDRVQAAVLSGLKFQRMR